MNDVSMWERKIYRAPDYTVRVDTSNLVRIQCNGRTFQAGHDAMRVLDVSHGDLTLKELVEKCAGGMSERAARDVLATIKVLLKGGVLSYEPQSFMSLLPFPRGGYDAPFVHFKILGDTKRKSAFVNAIRKVVTSDDVVLDLGTGSGILAIAAAQAGAKKVYALEPAGMVNVAKQIALDNGVADRIEFVRGWSTQIDLPEKATLLSTDIVGNDPFDMLIWETLTDARKRLLAPGAKLIPERIDVIVQPVEIPQDVIDEHQATKEMVDDWQDAYGIDFSLLAYNDAREWLGWYDRPEVVNKWVPLQEPQVIGSCSLHDDFVPFELPCKLRAKDASAMKANGVVVYFGISLIEEYFTSNPWLGGRESHWYTSVWAPSRGRELFDESGEASFVYRYLGEGVSVVD